jgi:hypothetical protein
MSSRISLSWVTLSLCPARGELRAVPTGVTTRLCATDREPHVVGLRDQVWICYASGERLACPPVATSDEALIATMQDVGHPRRADGARLVGHGTAG